MRKKHLSRKLKRYKGGFFETLTNGWTSLTQKTKNWWSRPSSLSFFSSSSNPAPPTPPSPPSPPPPPILKPEPEPEPEPYIPKEQPQNNVEPYVPKEQSNNMEMYDDKEQQQNNDYMRNPVGGRKMRKSRKRRTRRKRHSIKKGGMVTTHRSFADNALEYKGVETAQPSVWVGGKKRRKSCK